MTRQEVIEILNNEIYMAQTFERTLTEENLTRVLTYLKDN